MIEQQQKSSDFINENVATSTTASSVNKSDESRSDRINNPQQMHSNKRSKQEQQQQITVESFVESNDENNPHSSINLALSNIQIQQ